MNAAISIDKYLQGRDLYQERVIPKVKKMDFPRPQEEKGYSSAIMPTLPVSERLKGFKEVNLGLTLDMAQQEAARCLGCGAKECAAIFSADTVPALIALGAKIKVINGGKEKVMLLENIYSGKGDKPTTLEPEEFVTEVQIPAVAPHSGGSYSKHAVRKGIDFPLLGVASVVTLEGKEGACKDVKIVISGAASSPIRVKEAEALLKGKKLTAEVIEKAAEEAANKTKIISAGGRAESLSYRKKLIKALVKRSTIQAWKEATAN